MTDEAKALVERLRGDWPEILVEKHWMMDSDAIDKQRHEAADRIEQLEREKAVVSDLWEQQKEIALGYLADCNKAADRIEALEAALSWALIQLGSETGYNMESPIWHAYDRARSVLNG